MSRWARRLGFGLLALLALAAAGFLVWALTPLGPMPEAEAALVTDARVTVIEGRWIELVPAQDPEDRVRSLHVDRGPRSGIILYPGGRVDPRSYAPIARALAERGHLAVIVPMPLNLAVFAPDRAAEVIEAHPEVERWAVGGHSLGGSMAARFLRDAPDAADALFLWASYPAAADDLSARPLRVASVYGTLDGVATPDTVLAAEPLLPPDTDWVAIEGGNHAQFGWYGPQRGDLPATISREAQQAETLRATAVLLEGEWPADVP